MEDLESILHDVATTEGARTIIQERRKPWQSDEIKTLIANRKTCTSNAERMNISKQIQQLSRRELRKYHDEVTHAVLNEFADIGKSMPLATSQICGQLKGVKSIVTILQTCYNQYINRHYQFWILDQIKSMKYKNSQVVTYRRHSNTCEIGKVLTMRISLQKWSNMQVENFIWHYWSCLIKLSGTGIYHQIGIAHYLRCYRNLAI